MPNKRRTPTINDVAKAAGVSVSTVSRVLNDKDDVAPATYERVCKVIAKLGYHSSLAAKSLRSRRTNVIGMIMPDVEDPFSIQVMKGVNRAIVELDYDLIIYTNGDIRQNTLAVKEQQYVSLLNSSITDGVVIVTPVATSFSTLAPVVSIDPNINNPRGPAVISTNFKGALGVMEYLISLGHRRIGFIAGRTDLVSAERRQLAYEKALENVGIPLDPQLITQGDFTQETALVCAKKLLALKEPPTAIFAANDQSAIGVIKAAEVLGLCIPKDVSLVGFDNTPEATYLNLTTVDQGIEQMGYLGTRMLYDLIQGVTLDNYLIKIPTQLIVRGSCRAIPGNSSPLVRRE